ncbi:ribosomal biogenesis protein LAS1L-like isoform X2 [Ostrea edulis]|nr:ribosomal biogenesis protein LAS1L-like isoform X2 [Ostrea edulis]
MEKMMTWQSRALNKLPIAIESTMALCRACISHELAIQDGTFQDQYLKLMYEYSMAIIRFVNNITELGQTKSYRMPVHKIAENFGIPNWIVEMRHNATHRSMPSLSELTSGADWILEWLREDFWRAQFKIMENIKPRKMFDLNEDIESLDQVVEKYMTDTMQAIRSRVRIVSDYKDLLRLLERHKSRILWCIFKKGYFIPTQEQLRHYNINIKDLMSSRKLKLPEILEKLWGPLLNILHRMKLTSSLVQLMVSVVTERENFQNFWLCSWLQRIITSNARGVNYEERSIKSSKKKLYKYRRHIPHRLVLEKLLRHPSIYTRNIIKLLLPLQTPPIPSATQKKIWKLLDIMCGKSVKNDSTVGLGPVHSILDVGDSVVDVATDDNLPQDGEMQHRAQQFNQSPWVRDQDIMNWERIPVGSQNMFPGEIIPVKLDDSDDENMEEEDSLCQDDLISISGVDFDEDSVSNVAIKTWTGEEMNIIKQTMGLM